MDRITWILEEKKYNEDIINFLIDNNCKIEGILRPKKNKYKVGFTCDMNTFINDLDKFIEYNDGNYKTLSIYHYNFENNIRNRLYKN